MCCLYPIPCLCGFRGPPFGEARIFGIYAGVLHATDAIQCWSFRAAAFRHFQSLRSCRIALWSTTVGSDLSIMLSTCSLFFITKKSFGRYLEQVLSSGSPFLALPKSSTGNVLLAPLLSLWRIIELLTEDSFLVVFVLLFSHASCVREMPIFLALFSSSVSHQSAPPSPAFLSTAAIFRFSPRLGTSSIAPAFPGAAMWSMRVNVPLVLAKVACFNLHDVLERRKPSLSWGRPFRHDAGRASRRLVLPLRQKIASQRGLLGCSRHAALEASASRQL